MSERRKVSQAAQYPAEWRCECGKQGRSRTFWAAQRAAEAHRPKRGSHGCRIFVESSK